MNTLEASFWSNLYQTWSRLNMDHVGSKTRSVGQILEKLVDTLEATVLVQSSSNLVKIEYGSFLVKNLVNGSNHGKPGEHSRGPSFGPIIIKLSQGRIWIIPGQQLGH